MNRLHPWIFNYPLQHSKAFYPNKNNRDILSIKKHFKLMPLPFYVIQQALFETTIINPSLLLQILVKVFQTTSTPPSLLLLMNIFHLKLNSDFNYLTPF